MSHLAGSKTPGVFLLYLILALINVFGQLESCESSFPDAQSVLPCFKAGLPGFYDPCVGEEKSLKVLYQFRGVLHQVMSADNEALRIPKQCKWHRLPSILPGASVMEHFSSLGKCTELGFSTGVTGMD